MKRRSSSRRGGRRKNPPISSNARTIRRDAGLAQKYEVETVVGLEEYARRETRRLLGKAAQLAPMTSRSTAEGRFTIRYDGSIRRFHELSTVTAVHRIEHFAVPRPRALLGHQHLTRLLGVIHFMLDTQSPGTFQTFRITAAGAGSGVYSRLRQEIAAALGIESTDSAAHLQIAVRRAPTDDEGWQVLIRTSPMPLSARRWRVCDMPGALNATVASVMASLARPRSNERVLNLGCGSGTLMIERLGMGAVASITGVDISPDALQCADANLRAAGHRASVSLLQEDYTNLSIPDASVDTITADLPFGMLQGGSGDIASLYRSALAESARVATRNGSLVVITTRRSAILAAVEDNPGWNLANEIPLSIPHNRGYIKPHIYLLRRGRVASGQL